MTSDGLRDFDYDEADRLAKVRILQGGEAASVSYLTNGLGQRVFKGEPVAEQTLPDEETLGLDFIAWLKSKFRWMFENAQATASVGTSYAYAEGLPPWVLLGEYDNGSASGTGRTEYIWLPQPDGNVVPIAMYRNGQFYSIHTDHLGTPRLVKDNTNTPVWQWPYSAFGNNRPVGVLSTSSTSSYAITAGAAPLKATPPAAVMNLRFPGQYADSETGEFYNYFRNYDPRVGRYTQAGSDWLERWVESVAYVDGNPLSYADPLALWSVTVGAYTGVGGQMTFGNDGGNGFMTARFGFGLGGGVSYNPTGGIPGPAPQDPSSGGVVLSCSAKANFNAGPLSASLEKGAARNYSNSQSSTYGGASASGRDRFTGLGASGSLGGQITVYSGRK